MSATTIDVSRPGQAPAGGVSTWITLAAGWHVLYTLLALGGVVYIWSAADTTVALALWLKILLTVAGLALAVASAAAVLFILRRDHRGRVISLVINYLTFIAAGVGLLTVFQVFTGLDSLADTFMQGIPFLLLVFLGYVITVLGDRFETSNPARQRALRQVGKWVALAGGVVAIFAMGLLNGLRSVIERYNTPVPFLLTGLLVLLGLMLWVMWRRPTAEAFRATNADAEMLLGYLFLSPNLIGFMAFFAGPLLLSLYVSFTNWDAFGTSDWVGLQNYAELVNLTVAPLERADQLAREVLDVTVYDELSRITVLGRSYLIGAQDKLFWIALGNTLKYVLLVVPLCVIPALLLANLLNTKLPGMAFFRAAYFVPSVAAVVGIALVWQWLFNSTIGYINYGISLVVDFVNLIGLGEVADPQIRWLSSSNTALLSVIIMAAWQLIGFNTVLFLAGLQGIPRELYEAATVDGAGAWRKFRSLTIPLLAPTTFFVVTTTVIRTMQVFEEIFILIPGQNPAGPNNSTLSIVLYLYQKGFQRFEQGYASAIAWVLFPLIFSLTLVQFQRQRTAGSSYDA